MSAAAPLSTTPSPSLATLNALPEAAFVAALGGVFEHAPWVAEAASRQRPYASVDALHGAMLQAVEAAPEPVQLAFLRRHPELAGREAEAGTMTPESTHEQARGGLVGLSRDEVQRLRALNAAYAARHGFPLIIAVLDHDKAALLDVAARRVDAETADERAEAIRQIGRISRRRLERLMDAAPMR